jgi:hypothetical protein
MAEMEIHEAKLAEQVQRLTAANSELARRLALAEQDQARQPEAGRDLGALLERVGRLEASLAGVTSGCQEESREQKQAVARLLEGLAQERGHWVSSAEAFRDKVKELSVEYAGQLKERELRIALLEKKAVEQQEFIKWMEQEQAHRQRGKENLPREAST